MATEASKTDEQVQPGAEPSATSTRETASADRATDLTSDSAKPFSSDASRTLVFVAAAFVCLAITGIIEWSSRPAAIKEFGKVGEEFYPEFTDPTLASSLEVYVFDTENVRPLDFRVQQLENGRWVIPSHHNYPADAADQLARTAASVIGIRRGAMVTRWQADHAQFGVVNPQQDALNVDDIEGIGRRIILRGQDDTVLADYIIGNQADGQSGEYYVRHPDEEEVYLASLDIDLSTRFTDWIETDLLGIENWDVTELTINNYSFDELRGEISNREVSTLSRETSSDPWSLDGLDEENEEVDADAIRESVSTVASLSIAGVRPKQQGLTPDLKLDRQALRSQGDVDRLQTDLLARGFLLQPGEDGNQENLRLIAREGEMNVATSDGLVYRLHFGRAFTGSQEELEIGLTSTGSDSGENAAGGSTDPDAKQADESPEAAAGEPGNQEATKQADGTDDPSTSSKPGRYVFVRVEFDQKYLGEAPVQPVQPEMPAELKESPGDDQTSEQDPGQNADQADKQDESKTEETTSEEETEQEDRLAEIRSQYESNKLKYEADLQEYERLSKEYQQKVTDGQNKAEELNRRFAEWYYVIPGDSFDKLRLSRGDLVKEKAVEAEPDGESTSEGEGNTDDVPDSNVSDADSDRLGQDAAAASNPQSDKTGETEASESSGSKQEEKDSSAPDKSGETKPKTDPPKKDDQKSGGKQGR